MHLIFYGPEGSGKGTQAELLSERLDLPVYTSGDLVRLAAKEDKTIIGDSARAALNEGKYVPDDIMYILWKSRLESEEARKGFILDGFPRNVNQAEFIKQETVKFGYRIDKLIYLKLSGEESLKRLKLRHRTLYEGSTINHDDSRRVKQRLITYRALEKEIINFYKKEEILLEIEAMGTKEEVLTRILKGLNL